MDKPLSVLDEFVQGKQTEQRKHFHLCMNFFNRYRDDAGLSHYSDMKVEDFTKDFITAFIMRLCTEPSLSCQTVINYLSAMKLDLCEIHKGLEQTIFLDKRYYTGLRKGVNKRNSVFASLHE